MNLLDKFHFKDKNGITTTMEICDSFSRSKIDELNSELNLKQNIADNNLSTTNKNIVGAINEINSNLSDNQWVNVPITKNGSDSTMVGSVQHNSFLGLKKLEVRWSNIVGFSASEVLIFTFDSYYPNEPFIVPATVGGVSTYATYNSSMRGMYVAIPGGTYSANTEIRISGIMG